MPISGALAVLYSRAPAEGAGGPGGPGAGPPSPHTPRGAHAAGGVRDEHAAEWEQFWYTRELF